MGLTIENFMKLAKENKNSAKLIVSLKIFYRS